MFGQAQQWKRNWIAAGCCLAMAGCTGIRGRETQLQASAAPRQTYAAAAITYRLGAVPKRPAPSAPAAEGQLVSYVEAAPVEPSPAKPDKLQTLSIKYPHPNGKQGYALAELVVADPNVAAESTGWLTGLRRTVSETLPGVDYAPGIEAAYALDLPIAEVDQLIHQLDQDGYFGDAAAPPTVSTELYAQVNGLGFQKQWSSVPELNALVRRVRREGSLVSHRQPLQMPAPLRSSGSAATQVAQAMPAAAPIVQATAISLAPSGAASAVQTAVAIEPIAPGIERLPPVR